MLGKSSIFMGHTVLNMNVVIKFRSSIVKIYSSDDIEYRSYIIPVSLSLSLSKQMTSASSLMFWRSKRFIDSSCSYFVSLLAFSFFLNIFLVFRVDTNSWLELKLGKKGRKDIVWTHHLVFDVIWHFWHLAQ